jgi:uncharacterized protein (DUF1800 family)
MPSALFSQGEKKKQNVRVLELTETQRIRHVLSRFAFGPTPGLVERVRRQGLDSWFEDQLELKGKDPKLLLERLADLDTWGRSAADILLELQKIREDIGPDPKRKDRARLNRARNLARNQLKDAVLFQAIYSGNQVLETAVDFFRNHFNVTVNKGSVRYYATEYERDILRKGALNNFGWLLEHTAKSPAMLFYLDNYLSRRPPSKQDLKGIERRIRRKTKSKKRAEEEVQIAKQRGLNENYGRELLELHTLGVDNYYRQKDVIEVAKALTGWTINRNRKKKTVSFQFRPDMHVRGPKTFLGGTIPENKKTPIREGEMILERLVKHKGTAHFIAWKLCRWFVNDNPPEDCVQRIAKVFLKTKGDMKEVLRAIYHDSEFWNPKNFQVKFKRPFEFVVSALRVTGSEVRSTRALHRALTLLSEPVYECEDPTGYYDQAEAWNDPGVLAVRWSFAMKLATNKIRGIKIPDSFYADLHPNLPQVWKDQLARKMLPAGIGDQTDAVLDNIIRKVVNREKNLQAGRRRKPLKKVLAPLLVGLLLGSPEFQKQ